MSDHTSYFLKMLEIEPAATIISEEEKFENENDLKIPEGLGTKNCREYNFLSNHKKPVFENLSFIELKEILSKRKAPDWEENRYKS